MIYAIKRWYEIDPPATLSADTMSDFQDEVAAYPGVMEVSFDGSLTGDALVGLRVELTIEATDANNAGSLARQAIHGAIRSVGLREGSFRVTAGSGREV
jgi:hypothetical protein